MNDELAIMCALSGGHDPVAVIFPYNQGRDAMCRNCSLFMIQTDVRVPESWSSWGEWADYRVISECKLRSELPGSPKVLRR